MTERTLGKGPEDSRGVIWHCLGRYCPIQFLFFLLILTGYSPSRTDLLKLTFIILTCPLKFNKFLLKNLDVVRKIFHLVPTERERNKITIFYRVDIFVQYREARILIWKPNLHYFYPASLLKSFPFMAHSVFIYPYLWFSLHEKCCFGKQKPLLIHKMTIYLTIVKVHLSKIYASLFRQGAHKFCIVSLYFLAFLLPLLFSFICASAEFSRLFRLSWSFSRVISRLWLHKMTSILFLCMCSC